MGKREKGTGGIGLHRSRLRRGIETKATHIMLHTKTGNSASKTQSKTDC